MAVAAYLGWIGHNNIGDEALYLATQNLFENTQLVDVNQISEYDNLILGGGTLLPHYVTNTSLRGSELNVAIGVGARDPNFWNRPFSQLDFGYHIGKTKHNTLLENSIIKYITIPLREISDSFILYDHYLDEQKFSSVKDFDFDYLGVRGPRTHQLLSKYGIESKIVGDTALVLEPNSYHPQRQGRIAITLRDGAYQWSEDGNHVDLVLEFCRKYAEEYEFVFLPFSPQDIEIHRQAASQIPNASFRDYCSFIDIESVIDEISRCDLVIADKLHANILSACTYTPFISLEYRPKNLDFAESVGMDHFNVRSDQLSKRLLEEKVREAIHNESVSASLRNNVIEKRINIKQFVEDIVVDMQ